jgi:hypothetical protein
MSFKNKKHTPETKKKISDSRKLFTGKKHPRYGAEWNDDQRAKYILTMHHRRQEEKNIKMFLIKYDSLYRKFNSVK